MTSVTQEVKQSKILELANLISQYDNGERENINSSEYPQWQVISDMLKRAEISENIYADFLQNPTHYKIVDNKIIYNDNWEAEAQEAEQERISKLHITKQDFYLYLCVPASISYETLKAKIAELNMEPQWELCNHVYYGIIQPFLTALPLGKTEQEIIEIFEQYTKED